MIKGSGGGIIAHYTYARIRYCKFSFPAGTRTSIFCSYFKFWQVANGRQYASDPFDKIAGAFLSATGAASLSLYFYISYGRSALDILRAFSASSNENVKAAIPPHTKMQRGLGYRESASLCLRLPTCIIYFSFPSLRKSTTYRTARPSIIYLV